MTEKVELTPELLRELQLKQLDMLVYFRDFCEKNNLTFYLIGGALIGALRNCLLYTSPSPRDRG